MPRVHTQTKSRGGQTRHCGRCREEILPGETYYRWTFRGSGTHYACFRHPPRQSELTQSKMSQVYAAIESTQDSLPDTNTIEDINEAVHSVAEDVRSVAEEYRSAAEAVGGGGFGAENEERADALDGVAEELENWEATTPDEEEFDESKVGPQLSQEMFGIDAPNELELDQRQDWADRLQELRDEWDRDHEHNDTEVEAARSEASDFLSGLELP